MAIQDDGRDAALLCEKNEGVVTITINRPEKKNAITYAMWCGLAEHVGALGSDPAIRALVIRGAGNNFSAGADIGEFDAIRRDAATARGYEATNSAVFAAIRNAPMPVIAAIRGICFGGGFGLAAACDLRLAAPDAVFSVPAARLGLAYPQDAMIDIVSTAGPQMAKYMAFSAEPIDASAAFRTGFLLDIVDSQDLDDHANRLAHTIAGNAPLSIKASKASINAAITGDATAAAKARTLGDLTFDSRDYAEGRAAFRERRKARFRGE